MPPRPDAKTSSKPHDERRRARRKGAGHAGWIVSPTSTRSSDRIAVTALNISPRGIAFVSASAVPTGAYFRIELADVDPADPATGDAREIQIVHCNARSTGEFDVGAAFC